MGERQAMRRLWWAWAWSRLTRQHRISWWEVVVEVEREKDRAWVREALRRHFEGLDHIAAARSEP